jgi:3-hydroxy acid dehydrogenase/malonic semialdehyde reductase
MKGRLALITGATSGIGEATAIALAEAGSDLILAGRRADRLASLKTRLQEKTSVHITALTLDLRDRAACEAAFAAHRERLDQVDLLVNNAGLAKGVDPMPSAAIDDWEAMIDTNIKGLLYVTRAVLPAMVKRGRGDIVNLGSVAGRWTYPGGGVYCATKAAVLALTEGLRMDVKGTGVRVVNIEPGMVETEFSEVRLGTPEKARQVYEGMTPLSARDIAETIVWCIKRPAHVNVQELVIFPTDQAGVGLVHRR